MLTPTRNQHFLTARELCPLARRFQQKPAEQNGNMLPQLDLHSIEAFQKCILRGDPTTSCRSHVPPEYRSLVPLPRFESQPGGLSSPATSPVIRKPKFQILWGRLRPYKRS